MSDLTFPQPHSETGELVSANRRLTTAILGLTLLTGLVGCFAYLAGRTVTQIKTETATTVRMEIPPAPLVVEPLTPMAPAEKAAPVNLPPPGVYLQVGLMDAAVDRSMQQRLTQMGLQTQLAPMENSAVSRVVVGPIGSLAQQQEIQAKLAANGFQFFARRY